VKNTIHDLVWAVSSITNLTGDRVTSMSEGEAVWASPFNVSPDVNNHWLYLKYDENMKLKAVIYERGLPSKGWRGFYAAIGFLTWSDIPVEMDGGEL